jgi:hypothetical protein
MFDSTIANLLASAAILATFVVTFVGWLGGQ